MAQDAQQGSGGGLRLGDAAIVVVVGLVGLVVAFWLLGHVLGVLWFLVKVALLAAVVVAVLALLSRRRR